jgi:predicted PurR-regulated permease PerM
LTPPPGTTGGAAAPGAASQDALWVTILFAIMLYLLYFFFRDGERIVERVTRVLPVGDERRNRLLLKFTQVVRATVKAT